MALYPVVAPSLDLIWNSMFLLDEKNNNIRMYPEKDNNWLLSVW